MQKPAQRQHLFGAPLIEPDRRDFERAVLKRFDMSTERALAFMDKIAGRQIDKARALLPFNAILFAVLVFSDARETIPRLALLGGLLALLACLMLVALLYQTWGPVGNYADEATDFKVSCEACYRRAMLLSSSLALSAVTTLIVAWPLLRQVGP